jgi:hypothetical protein
MMNFPKWSDVRADILAASGGEEAVAEARRRNQACIDGHLLAERRKSMGLSDRCRRPDGSDQEPGLPDRTR